MDVNAYLNRIRDLIQTDTDSARSDNGILLYTYDNVARARTQGLETAITWAPSAAWTKTSQNDTHCINDEKEYYPSIYCY